MRVVRIITRLNVGGPTFHVHRLARDHREMGIETHVVCGTPAHGEGDRTERLRADGIPVHAVAELGREPNLARDRRALGAVRSILNQLRPDVVHTHQAKAGALGRIAARRAGVPVVFHTFHGHVFEGYFSPWRSRVWIGVERWLARRTDRLLVPGEALLENLMRFRIAPREKFESYVQPIDWDAFDENRAGSDPSVREAFAWAGAPLDGETARRRATVLGIVGRLAPIKAHDLLFEALGRIPTDSAVRVLVFGDGPIREDLERDVVARGLANRVRFVGRVSNGPSLYEGLDALVCCSRNEGVPLCVIEARSCGVAVIATDVGGMRDAVDTQGGDRLVGFDAADLAGAIRDLIDSHETATPRDRNLRDRVRERHDPARVSRRIAESYREVLVRKRDVGAETPQRPGGAIRQGEERRTESGP